MFDRVRDVIAEVMLLETDEVKMDSNLIENLECDDIDLAEILTSLELEFSIEGKFPEDDFMECKTVEDILNLITPYV